MTLPVGSSSESSQRAAEALGLSDHQSDGRAGEAQPYASPDTGGALFIGREVLNRLVVIAQQQELPAEGQTLMELVHSSLETIPRESVDDHMFPRIAAITQVIFPDTHPNVRPTWSAVLLCTAAIGDRHIMRGGPTVIRDAAALLLRLSTDLSDKQLRQVVKDHSASRFRLLQKLTGYQDWPELRTGLQKIMELGDAALRSADEPEEIAQVKQLL